MKVLDLVSQLESEGVRLWEDRGDLRFRAPLGVMTQERRAALRSRKQDVIAWLSGRDNPSILEPQPLARHEPFPVTDIQTAYLLGRGRTFPFGGIGCHGYTELFFPHLDPARLTAAWGLVIRRHDMLRAVISIDGSQRVLSEVPRYSIPLQDLRGLEPTQAAAEIEKIRTQMDHHLYQPDTWPLFDLRVTVKDDGALLHFSIDLLVSDFVSTQLVLVELQRLYSEPDSALAQPQLTFRDYVLGAKKLKHSEAYRQHRDYWLGLIDSLPPAPELPTLDRSFTDAVRFERRQTRLTVEEWATLSANAKKRDVTPSAAVLAAYADVIGRWSGRPQFTLNVTLQNRLPLHPDVDKIVGDFTSLELLAVDLDQGACLIDRIRALQTRLWQDLDHRLFSGSELIREISRRRGIDDAFFPIVFTSSIGVEVGDGAAPPAFDRAVYGITQTPQVWIDCQVMATAKGLLVNWDTRREVLLPEVVDTMFLTFEGLLFRLGREDAVWEETDPVALPPDQLELRASVNATNAPAPDLLLHESAVAQALRSPERLAVISRERTLSYGELLNRAVSVSDTLRTKGAVPGELIGIMLHKGCDQLIAVLGTLLAECVYVPLDPDHPLARRNQIVSDAGIKLILSHSSSADGDWPVGRRLIAVDQVPLTSSWDVPPRRFEGMNDPAYVVHTSGSTGSPKGVVISHLSAANTVTDVNQRFAVGPDDRVLALSSLGFDLSVYDIFGPLSVGGCVVMPDHARRADPSHWAQLIADHRVTLWNSVPTQLQMLCDYLITDSDGVDSLASLRLAMLSGDWIPITLPDRIRELLPHLELVSLGGATEAAIWSIFQPIDGVAPTWRSIPYGRPLTNQTVQVLDAALRPCPDWVKGEIYIGGLGLALEYLGDKQQTAERFIRHPRTGERLYRTGDFGRYMRDGSIELIGREDRQVKIRGHRIELAEVEGALRSYPMADNAAVIAHGARPLERQLIAFLATARRAPGAPTDLDPASLAHAAMAAGIDLQRTVEQSRYAEYAAQLDHAALLSMLFALNEHRQLESCLHTGGGDALHPLSTWLVRRWRRALITHGLLTDTSATPLRQQVRGIDQACLEEAWRRVADLAEGIEDRSVIDGFRTCALQLPGRLGSEKSARQISSSESSLDFIEAVARDALLAKWGRRVAAGALRQLASAASPQKLRVLELGATAPVALEETALLSGLDIEFLVTDPSPLLVERTTNRCAGRPIRTAVFRPDLDYRVQAMQANSFDVVIACNMLHRMHNIDEVLHSIRELLVPAGWLILVEMTRDHPAIMISLEPMLSASEHAPSFTDARREGDRLYLSPEEWSSALLSAEAKPVLCVSRDSDVLARSGMHVFASCFKQDRVQVDVADLRDFLARRLPDYMLPSKIHVVDALPLTANGKIDYKKVRTWITETDAPVAVEKKSSCGRLENRLAELWAELLNVPEVSRDQGFLHLGGDSLSAAKLAGRMRESIPEAKVIFFDELLRKILDNPTIVGLAEALVGREEIPRPARKGSAVSVRRLKGSGLPIRALVQDAAGGLAPYEPFISELARSGSVLGLVVEDAEAYLRMEPGSLVTRAAEAYVNALIDGEFLRVDVVGCAEAAGLAVEIARQLLEAGVIVDRLIVIDARPPLRCSDLECDKGAGEALRNHSRHAFDRSEASAYAGDITILSCCEQAESSQRLAARWRATCLGDLRIVPGGDNADRLLQILLEQHA
jgi:pyochelin synthetase